MSERALILIIDDLPQNVEVIGEYLADEYDIQCAFSGAEGLALIAETLPDLILLDVMMPNMDGYAVCDALQRDVRTREVPIIFITAKNDAESETQALAAGGVDFIHKPVNPSVLRARVGTHIKLQRHIEELHRLAARDPLTGMANRRVLYERLELQWRRAMRRQTPLSLLMIDIDFFKPYNDRYGHLEGDICLQKVARTIAGAVSRVDDLAARFGGEEFVVLLADATADQAATVAERILANVRALNLPHAGSTVSDRVTVSIGLASAWPCHDTDVAVHAMEPNSPEATLHAAWTLMGIADQTLYAAKHAGRDRLACLTPAVAAPN